MKDYNKLIILLTHMEFYRQLINNNELSENELVQAKKLYRQYKSEYLRLHMKMFKEEIKQL